MRLRLLITLALLCGACGAGSPGDTSGSLCGNGRLDPGEECDGAARHPETRSCVELGGTGGEPGCFDDCSIDASACEGVCGNGRIDAMVGGIRACEECDGDDLGGATCADFGGSGALSCGPSCSLALDGCDGVCGNGRLDPGEPCEPGRGRSVFAEGQSCAALGFLGGNLVCTSGCEVISSQCESVCGDGLVGFDPDGVAIFPGAFEVCDGSNLGGFAESCMDFGFREGTIACEADCMSLDVSACGPAPLCGNGRAEYGETCDGLDVRGYRCEDGLVFDGGSLACSADCSGFDFSMCTPPPVCGNGRAEGFEECDGDDPFDRSPSFSPEAICQRNGFAGGLARCTADCRYDTGGCVPPPVSCGNGRLDPGEPCELVRSDSGNTSLLRDQTCKSLGYRGGALSCATDFGPDGLVSLCALDTTRCVAASCGNGRADPGEECDGADLRGETCESNGRDGGTLSCDGDCRISERGCTRLCPVPAAQNPGAPTAEVFATPSQVPAGGTSEITVRAIAPGGQPLAGATVVLTLGGGTFVGGEVGTFGTRKTGLTDSTGTFRATWQTADAEAYSPPGLSYPILAEVTKLGYESVEVQGNVMVTVGGTGLRTSRRASGP